ncbi:MAG: hypothetical protein ACOWWM_02815 [Desulfobacterales bacterium]
MMPIRSSPERRSSWQPVAWDGIEMEAPSDWAVQIAAPGYLVMGPDAERALEIKTSAMGKKPLSPRRLLKRLARGSPVSLRGRIRTVPLSKDWQPLTERFAATGFEWRHLNHQGTGAILQCRTCRRVTLVQALRHPAPAGGTIRRIAETLRDHREDGFRSFRIFDFSAVVPPGFETAACRFAPGHFEIDFSGERHRIRFVRFGPAEVLLKRISLDAFVKSKGLLPEETPRLRRPSGNWKEWAWETNDSRKWGIGARKHIHRRLRVFCRTATNHILTLETRGGDPFPDPLFETVWAAYADLEETPIAPRHQP